MVRKYRACLLINGAVGQTGVHSRQDVQLRISLCTFTIPLQSSKISTQEPILAGRFMRRGFFEQRLLPADGPFSFASMVFLEREALATDVFLELELSGLFWPVLATEVFLDLFTLLFAGFSLSSSDSTIVCGKRNWTTTFTFWGWFPLPVGTTVTAVRLLLWLVSPGRSAGNGKNDMASKKHPRLPNVSEPKRRFIDFPNGWLEAKELQQNQHFQHISPHPLTKHETAKRKTSSVSAFSPLRLRTHWPVSGEEVHLGQVLPSLALRFLGWNPNFSGMRTFHNASWIYFRWWTKTKKCCIFLTPML